MAPVCGVRREPYLGSPRKGVAAIVMMRYVGPGLRREEWRCNEVSSDWSDSIRRRVSEDNGRTWAPWQVVYHEYPTQGDYTREQSPGEVCYDPVSGRLVQTVYHRLLQGEPAKAMEVIWSGNKLFWDHLFYQVSEDGGLSWGELRQLQYESGLAYDPDDWSNPGFLLANEAYLGGMTALPNGSVIVTATVPVPYRDAEDQKYPAIYPNGAREGCVGGVVCFIGRWNAPRKEHDWNVSAPVFVPRRVSTRGLVESDLSQLTDGRLLMIMRGSNTGLDPVANPGRKWMATSPDGGLTWSPVTDLGYDTGEQFYSPASFLRTIRSSKTGKLYWIGNISATPPDGDRPRYPLQIAEVDETIPALKRDTVTIIDDRQPNAPPVQLSNFSVLENRETLEMELYMSRYGERGTGPDAATADAYKYTLAF